MRIPAFILTSFVLSMASTSALAQYPTMHPRVDPELQDTSSERDVLHGRCAVGDSDACFAIEFGNCADKNPRVAIPACTQQLAQQDSRRAGGNIRFERALRYMLRAHAYSKQGNHDLALRDYDRAVAADSSVNWIHIQRGDANFLAGNFEQALVSYDAALKLNSESAAALNNRALILAAAPDERLRNPVQALADAEMANALAPGQPAYIDCLAVAHAANGDFTRAVAEEQRAIALLPEGNQAVLDDFRSRLALFENGMAFQIAAGANS